jgi:nesprin-1
LNGKYIQVKKILELIKDLSTNCAQIDSELQKVEQQLSEFDPYSKDVDQNQHTIDQINNKLNNYRTEIKKLSTSLDEFEEFIAPEITQHLKDLELKVERLLDTMEGHNRAFKMAKTVRSDYLFNTEKVHCWINDTEEKLKSHYTEPLEYKVSIHNSCQERPAVSEWFDTANKSGQSIIESTHDEHEALSIRHNLEQTRERLGHVFTLLDEQKIIIDNVVDAWSKFMELYQIIVNWAAEKRIFVSQDLKINNQQEAQTKLNEYSVGWRAYHGSALNHKVYNEILETTAGKKKRFFIEI